MGLFLALQLEPEKLQALLRQLRGGDSREAIDDALESGRDGFVVDAFLHLPIGHEVEPAGYFTRWLLHPLRIDPETKMSRFVTDDGKTPLTDILGGDGRAQVDAMWQYLHSLKK